MTKGQNLYH